MKTTPSPLLSAPERRRFLKLSATTGFTVAAVAAGGGALFSPEAVAQTKNEERERAEAAKYTMTIATSYRVGTDRTFPVMQLHLKENIQNATRGRIYVKLVPGGAIGSDSELAQKVQAGTIQGAQHSMSNFAPFAPAVDLINMPYWCGDNQQFVNLVSSRAWAEHVNQRVEANGFKPLLYQCVDPRTISLRKGFRDTPIRTPEDLRGMKFRVPGSKILAQVYRLMGANPTPVSWGETASAIRQGVADGLDPNVMGLNLFGFKEIISHVSFIRAVPDGGAYSCNLKWFQSLDSDTQEALLWAAQITFLQNMAHVPAAREFAMAEMEQAGVQFYHPNKDELAQWKEAAGAQRSEWDDMKKSLVGSLDVFEQLNQAANTPSRYYVHDV